MNNGLSGCLRMAGVMVILWIVGCGYLPEEKYYELEVEPEKLYEIERLDLEEMSAAGEANEPNAPAQTLDITLEEARKLALENNLELKAELISPAIAGERVREEEAKFEWAFFSNLNYRQIDAPPAEPLALSGSNVHSASADLGVEIPLQTGGTAIFDFVDTRTKSNQSTFTFNPSYDTNGSFSISQPLLQGAGVRVNRHSIRIAEYDRQIQDAATKLEIIRVIAAVDRVYWRLYAAKRELAVRQQEYELAQAQLDKARRFVATGEMSQVEIIRAEAGVAETLEGIINAENAVLDRQRELKRVLNMAGVEMGGPTAIVPATEPDPVHYLLDAERMVEAGLANRMEMLELELQLAQNISTIDFLKNQALPLVNAEYTYNVNGLGSTRSDSLDLLTDRRFEDHFAGLRVVVPLGNEAAKSRLRGVFYTRMQQLATRDSRASLIEVEVLNAIDQIEANWQRILASRQNSILQGRLYQAEQRQFELGLRTSTDVLDAQTNFANAQSAEILALAEYEISLVDAAFATGTLLGAAKVGWEPTVPKSNIR